VSPAAGGMLPRIVIDSVVQGRLTGFLPGKHGNLQGNATWAQGSWVSLISRDFQFCSPVGPLFRCVDFVYRVPRMFFSERSGWFCLNDLRVKGFHRASCKNATNPGFQTDPNLMSWSCQFFVSGRSLSRAPPGGIGVLRRRGITVMIDGNNGRWRRTGEVGGRGVDCDVLHACPCLRRR
jgi:hypothetical protein